MDPPNDSIDGLGLTFNNLSRDDKLLAIYRSQLHTQRLTMALADQIATLNGRVTTLEGAVTTLGEKVDAEQAQVQSAIDLLSADSPDLAAVITKLEGVAANLGTITADVESTIPDEA